MIKNKMTQTTVQRRLIQKPVLVSLRNALRPKLTTVQDVVNYKIDGHFSNSSTESARESSTDREIPKMITNTSFQESFEDTSFGERRRLMETRNYSIATALQTAKIANTKRKYASNMYAPGNQTRRTDNNTYAIENQTCHTDDKIYGIENQTTRADNKMYVAQNQTWRTNNNMYATENQTRRPDNKLYVIEYQMKHTGNRMRATENQTRIMDDKTLYATETRTKRTYNKTYATEDQTRRPCNKTYVTEDQTRRPFNKTYVTEVQTRRPCNKTYVTEDQTRRPCNETYVTENQTRRTNNKTYVRNEEASENPTRRVVDKKYVTENQTKNIEATVYVIENTNRSISLGNQNRATNVERQSQLKTYSKKPNRSTENKTYTVNQIENSDYVLVVSKKQADNKINETLNSNNALKSSIYIDNQSENSVDMNQNSVAKVITENIDRSETDYPNMSALTDVSLGDRAEVISEASTEPSGSSSVYYHKKIRAEQVRTQR